MSQPNLPERNFDFSFLSQIKNDVVIIGERRIWIWMYLVLDEREIKIIILSSMKNNGKLYFNIRVSLLTIYMQTHWRILYLQFHFFHLLKWQKFKKIFHSFICGLSPYVIAIFGNSYLLSNIELKCWKTSSLARYFKVLQNCMQSHIEMYYRKCSSGSRNNSHLSGIFEGEYSNERTK